ncbi:MAG TPA: Gfo/Idh/MocA family oxidoreductase [Candidatus Binatia bacterium]|nr:Gfo/Idh/MocA family oxidoreductase [Candidatus Binatia bacterium]
MTGKVHVRAGIVGVGRHGSRYARHAATDVEGIELVAISRRNRAEGEKLARELGCDFTDSALDLVRREDIDTVILVTVPNLLPELVAAAVGAGKRLLIEKPVAADLDAGRTILGALEASGTYCLAGHTLRLNAAVAALRRELPSLGRIDSFLFSQRFPPQLSIDWLDDPSRSGGGNILHTGVHCFDLLQWLSGFRVSSVCARARSIYTRGTEDSFIASLVLEGSTAMAQVACSRTTDSRNGLIEVSGERGQLIVDHVLGTGYRIGPRGRENLAIEPARMTVRELLEQLVRDVSSGAGPAIPYVEALSAVAVADACYRSIASHSFESVKPVSSATTGNTGTPGA